MDAHDFGEPADAPPQRDRLLACSKPQTRRPTPASHHHRQPTPTTPKKCETRVTRAPGKRRGVNRATPESSLIFTTPAWPPAAPDTGRKIRSGSRDLLCRCRCRCRWLERDGVSESFELSDQAFGGPFALFALGVGVDDRRAVELAVLEHVVERDQDRVFDRADRDLVPGACLDPSVLAGEVAVLDADRAHRCVVQRAVEPLRALARTSRSSLPGGLVIAGTLRGPTGEVRV